MPTAGSDLPDFGGRTNLVVSYQSKCGEIEEEHCQTDCYGDLLHQVFTLYLSGKD